MVASNYSLIHGYFTYRECAVIVMALMCAIFSTIRIKDDNLPERNKTNILAK